MWPPRGRLTRVAALGLLALLLAPACGRLPPRDTLVLVNGEAISNRDLQRQLKLLGLPEGAGGAAKGAVPVSPSASAQVLEDLVDQALVLQEAERLNLALSPQELENQLALARAGTSPEDFAAALRERGLSFDDWREQIRRRALCDEVVRREIRSQIPIKPQDLRDYYWEHVTQFRRSESVKLRQVFCKSRGEAEKALNELRLGDAIAEVAARHSVAPEAAEGGDMGWVQRKDLPAKLAKAAFALKKGKFSDILSSPYGWHILYAEDRRPEASFTLEQSAPEILEDLLRQREQPLYRDWLAGLRGKADIKRFEPFKGTS